VKYLLALIAVGASLPLLIVASNWNAARKAKQVQAEKQQVLALIRDQKRRECQQMFTMLDAVIAQTSSDNSKQLTRRSFANKIDGLISELVAVEIGNPKLTELRQDFIEVYTQTRNAALIANTSSEHFNEIYQSERKIISEFNRFCSSTVVNGYEEKEIDGKLQLSEPKPGTPVPSRGPFPGRL